MKHICAMALGFLCLVPLLVLAWALSLMPVVFVVAFAFLQAWFLGGAIIDYFFPHAFPEE